jgi:hypothetical protein
VRGRFSLLIAALGCLLQPMAAWTQSSPPASAAEREDSGGYAGLVEDIDQINREGKGFASLLKDLEVEPGPAYTACSDDPDAPAYTVKFSVDTLTGKGRVRGHVLEARTRHMTPDGEVRTVSIERAFIPAPDGDLEQAQESLLQAVSSVLERACDTPDSSLFERVRGALRKSAASCEERGNDACWLEMLNTIPAIGKRG